MKLSPMTNSPERIMHNYIEAYEQLYNRKPKELLAIDREWVVVNGARMRLSELEQLTHQLQLEYKQILAQRRGIVQRLIGLFRS